MIKSLLPRTRRSQILAVVLGGAALAAAGAVARAATSSDGVIHACYEDHGGGHVRIVAAAEACDKHEVAISWNQTGPAGAQGAQGLPGVAGPVGATGAPGAQGFPGAQGAAGPAGPSGATGAQGPVGPQGPAGVGGSTTPPSQVVGTIQFDDGPALSIFNAAVSIENTATAGGSTGAGAGKAKFNEFAIKKATDVASPVFARNCASGTHYKAVTVELRHTGSTDTTVIRYALKDALITSYATSAGGTSADPPTETVSLSYSSLMESVESPDGNVSSGELGGGGKI